MPPTKKTYRTIENCDKIHATKKKETDEKMKENKAWAWKKLLLYLGILTTLSTIGVRLLMAHVANETTQDVEIGKTQVEVSHIKEDVTETKGEVKEIKKEVQKLEGMSQKLDMIIFYQENGL